MSYLQFFAWKRAAQRLAGQSVFGGIAGVGGADELPSMRIAALAMAGEEAPAMGVIAALRHLLSAHSDIKVYPAYYVPDSPQALHHAAEYVPFNEIKNQLSIRGEYRDGGSFTIYLEGMLVEEGRAVFQNETDKSFALEAVADMATKIAQTLGVEPRAEWSQLSNEVSPFSELWDLEDRLVCSLFEDTLDEAAFLSEFEAIIGMIAPNTLESYILGQFSQEVATGPYGASAGLLSAMLEASSANRNDTVLVPLVRGLIQTGRSDMVVDALMDTIEAHPEDARLLFVDAAVYSGHIIHAVRVLQSTLSQTQSAVAARAYADTMRYLFETERLEPSIHFAFSQTEDVVEDIVEAYRYAYEKEPLSETGLKLLDFQLAVELEPDADIIVSIVGRDSSGVECQNLISTLSENEYLEAAIEAIEALDELSDNHLLGLATLYVEIDDFEAAKECLDEVRDTTTSYYKQLAYQVAVPEADQLIQEMSQRLSAGQTLTDEQIDVLESIVSIYDAHEAAYAVLARAYAAQGDLDAAIEVLEDAAKHLNSSTPYLLKAQLYWNTEMHEQAITALLDGAGQYPHDAVIYAQLARYLFDLDQLDEAREFLRKADFLSPDSAFVEQVKAYIGASLADE